MPIYRIITDADAGFADSVTATAPGRWVYLSGAVGFDASGVLVSGGLGAESEATFNNLERSLARAGGDLSHVVKISAFITQLGDYAQYAEVRKRRFLGANPASSTVQVAGLLAGAQIEIEAVAFIPQESGGSQS